MAPQNEGDKKSGNEQAEGDNIDSKSSESDSIIMEGKEPQIEPYSDDDPLRSTRINSLASETAGLLDKVQAQPTGFERATGEELRNIHEDAIERSKWSTSRQDGFTGILRLGRPVPPRARRVL